MSAVELGQQIRSKLDPRLVNLAAWQELKAVAKKHPSLVQNPLDTRKLPNFKRWRYNNIFEFPTHTGVDYHVWEDGRGKFHFVRNLTEVKQVLPGVVIGATNLFDAEMPNDDPYSNLVAVLHSFPQQGDSVLISIYAHVEWAQGTLKVGQPMPRTWLASCWPRTDVESMAFNHLVRHLHFATVNGVLADLNSLQGKSFSSENEMAEFLWEMFLPGARRNINRFPGNQNPLQALPLKEPPRFAFFRHENINRTVLPQDSFVNEFGKWHKF